MELARLVDLRDQHEVLRFFATLGTYSTSTRCSIRQRVAPVEWWRASGNMVEIADFYEPNTYKEAAIGPDKLHWKAAIAAELPSMDDPEVFIQSTLPTGQHAIDTNCVFKVKRHADGSVQKYKGRLVARGLK